MWKTWKHLVLLYFFAASGCTLTHISETKPKMFDGDLETLKARFDEIEEHKDTWDTLTDKGFIFEDSNIKKIPGVRGVRLVFEREQENTTVFQGLFRLPRIEDLDTFLDQFKPYTLVLIPHRHVEEKRDILFINNANYEVAGHDITFLIVFKRETVTQDGVAVLGEDGVPLFRDIVIHKEPSESYITEHSEDHALLLGIWVILGFVSNKVDEGRKIGNASVNPFNK